MVIVCFIRSDDTECWNKKCSNPLPAPLQLPKCPTKAEAVPQEQQECELQSQGSPCSTQLSGCWPSLASWAAEPQLLASQQSSCPAHTPDRSFPTHSLRPALKKTACPVPFLGVTTASKVRAELFIYLLHKIDISSRHFRTYMLRENCFAPNKGKQLATHSSCHWCSDGDAAMPHLKHGH